MKIWVFAASHWKLSEEKQSEASAEPLLCLLQAGGLTIFYRAEQLLPFRTKFWLSFHEKTDFGASFILQLEAFNIQDYCIYYY